MEYRWLSPLFGRGHVFCEKSLDLCATLDTPRLLSRCCIPVNTTRSYILILCIIGHYFFPEIGRGATADPFPGQRELAPTCLAICTNSGRLFVGCGASAEVLVVDSQAGASQTRIAVGSAPSGMALSQTRAELYVTCAAPASRLAIIDMRGPRCVDQIKLGHTAVSPVRSPASDVLYVCHRFENEVVFVDLETRAIRRRVPVAREPISMDVTPDGKVLLVAHHIHSGRADADYVAATLSVVDTASGAVVDSIALPNGSGLLRDVRV